MSHIAPPARVLRVLLTDYKNADITAEIPALFARAGCIVDVYCSERSWLCKGIRAGVWHRSPAGNPRHYVDQLVQFAQSGVYDWIVLTDDDALRMVHDYADDTQAQSLLPLQYMSYQGLAGSKATLSLLSQQHDICTPLFAVYEGVGDIVQTSSNVPYPLLLKVDRSGGGKGIFFCSDEEELRAAYAQIKDDQRKNIVVQQYIYGDNISVEALFRNGVLLACARARVVTNTQSEFSVSCVREYEPDEILTTQVASIGKKLGFNGFCSFTFLQECATHRYYLVEADLRTHLWFVLSRFAGVDFAKAIQAYLTDSKSFLPQFAETVHMRHFYRDMVRTLRAKDWRNLWKWIFNTDGRWRYIPQNDPRLLGAICLEIIRTYMYSSTLLRPFGATLMHAYRQISPVFLSKASHL